MKKLAVAAGIVAGLAFGSSAVAQTKPTVPVIVKDMTSPHWRAVLAGARKAGQDLGVNVIELGAQSENDVSGQISILETAVTSNPAAIVIAPTQFAALGKPIDEAAKRVKIIGLESAAETKAMTSLLATDNVNAGRIAADALAAAITKSFAIWLRATRGRRAQDALANRKNAAARVRVARKSWLLAMWRSPELTAAGSGQRKPSALARGERHHINAAITTMQAAQSIHKGAGTPNRAMAKPASAGPTARLKL